MKQNLRDVSDGRLIEVLLRADTPHDMLTLVHECGRIAGFNHLSYVAGVPSESVNISGDRTVKEIRHFSTCGDDWLKALFSENSPEDDYDVQRFLAGFSAPFVSGINILRLMAPVSAEHRRLLVLKAAFGFGANFFIPLPATPFAETSYAAVVFTSAMDEDAFRISMTRWSHWLVAAAYLLHYRLGGDAHAFLENGYPTVGRVSRPGPVSDPSDPGLAHRQKEILEALARGERAPAIAHRLGISKVTVDRHIKAARDAVGAGTTAEAVAKALSRGLISL